MTATITMLHEITQTTSSEETETSFVHPLYTDNKTRWEKMKDLLGGETVVKDLGETYLPKTDGQKRGPNGSANYDAYKTRAVFWDYVREIAVATEGMLSRKPPEIKVPQALDSMVERCTPTGQSMADFVAMVQAGQVEYGRIGILADIPDVPNPTGFFLYRARTRSPTFSKGGRSMSGVAPVTFAKANGTRSLFLPLYIG